MEVTEDLLNHLMELSKLHLSKEEKEQAKNDLNQMLEYIQVLDEIEIDDIKSEIRNYHMDNYHNNVFREDVVSCKEKEELKANREYILQQAPNRKNHTFVVPKTIDERREK